MKQIIGNIDYQDIKAPDPLLEIESINSSLKEETNRNQDPTNNFHFEVQEEIKEDSEENHSSVEESCSSNSM